MEPQNNRCVMQRQWDCFSSCQMLNGMHSHEVGFAVITASMWREGFLHRVVKDETVLCFHLLKADSTVQPGETER